MAKKKRRKQKQKNSVVEPADRLVPESRSDASPDTAEAAASPHPETIADAPEKNDSNEPAGRPSALEPTDTHARAARTDRRDFLSSSGKILTGICGTAVGIGALRLAVPNLDQTHESRIVLGRPVDFKMNTLTWLRDRSLFVMRDDKGVGAFSSKCTHLGCTVQRTEGGFLCPCHGARFDEMGGVVHGPAVKPLPWYRVVRYPDGRLWVHLDEPVDAGPAVIADRKEG